MSSLGPDDDLLERCEAASEIPIARASSLPTVTDLAAAPLWTAFRDYYTRAKARTRLNAEGEFACDELSQD